MPAYGAIQELKKMVVRGSHKGALTYTEPERKKLPGFSAKKKGIWPPADLTTSEIDEEVVKGEKRGTRLKH